MNEAAFQEGRPKSPVNFRIRSQRFVPKFIEGGLRGQSLKVVDCASQSFRRTGVIERRGGHGAVDCHHAFGAGQEGREVPAIDEDDARQHPMFGGDSSCLRPARDQVVVEGVAFDDEVVVSRRVGGEGSQDGIHDLLQIMEIGVQSDLAVAVELQWQQEKWLVCLEKA